MAMNFWEAQRKARSRTTLYLTVFVILTLGIAAAAEWAMREFAGPDYHPPLPYIGLIFLGVTFFVAGGQYMLYSTQGGSYVAESVGAYRVDPRTDDMAERQLLNIVEEMAVAASLPMPAVYIMEADQINAFAAGLRSDNAAIAITDGALRRLKRDEIQGVIAHEFGHIYNGDMRISLRLAAMVMGFYFAFFLGLRVLQFAGLSERRRSREDERNGGNGNVVALAAIILFIAGAITWLAGSILKAMVSREREYLADACAVQFTRNPSGIANALRKIAKDSVEDMPKDGASLSHMYFNDTSFLSNVFATHPPIEKRIAAIEGRTYMPEEWKKDLES
jgi:heat shock protein HtpX